MTKLPNSQMPKKITINLELLDLSLKSMNTQ